MIAQFTLIPLGLKGDSLSDTLSRAMKPLVKSGLNYKIGPMGSVVEGKWKQVMDVIDLCRKAALKEVPRVAIHIYVDDRPAAKNPMTNKVLSLERKMGTSVKK